MIMSWVGMVTGLPSAGLRMLLVDSIRILASACASADSGTCTAIWSPSKSALNAVQTSGWIWIALPSTSCGSNAWIPSRCSVGARFSSTGCSRMTSSSTSQTTGLARSTIRLADLMFCAWFRSTSRFITNGLNSSTAVVEQGVDRLLEHPLLIVNNDLRCTEVQQPLEPVVPVDNPPVQVVQVRGGEPAAVELNHRPQVRRDHWDAVEHHAERAVGGVQERGDNLEPLQRPRLALALAGPDRLAQAGRLGIEVEAADPLLDRLGAHAAPEVPAEPVPHLAVQQLVALEVLDLQVPEPAPDLLDPVDLTLRAAPLAPAASSSARSFSSLDCLASTSTSRRCSIWLFSFVIFASSDGRSRSRASMSTYVIM